MLGIRPRASDVFLVDPGFDPPLDLTLRAEQLQTFDKQPVAKWGLVLSVLMSLIMHLLFLFWFLPIGADKVKPTRPKSFQVQLHYAAVSEPELASESVVEPVDDENSEPNVQPMVSPAAVTPEPITLADEQESLADNDAITPIEKLSVDRIITTQNKYSDSYLPSLNRPIATQPGSNPERFGSVFHPHLRERLQHQAVSVSTTMSELSVATNVYSETLVELNDRGSCLMAEERLSGSGPRNWYMTSCAGFRNEGERMMERVNSEVKRRR
jgi:cytoskeletal protein RodZ